LIGLADSQNPSFFPLRSARDASVPSFAGLPHPERLHRQPTASRPPSFFPDRPNTQFSLTIGLVDFSRSAGRTGYFSPREPEAFLVPDQTPRSPTMRSLFFFFFRSMSDRFFFFFSFFSIPFGFSSCRLDHRSPHHESPFSPPFPVSIPVLPRPFGTFTSALIYFSIPAVSFFVL